VSNVQQLYQLQQLDSQVNACRRRLTDIAANLRETEILKSARSVQQAAETACNQARALVTNLDLEVKGLQQKISQNEKRLYSGKLVNPKEAASLQDEIASTKRWLSKREEDLLDAMIELEDAEATLQERQRVFADIQAQWKAEQVELRQEQAKLQTDVQAATDARAKLARLIEQKDLVLYEKLRKQKGGVAVTGVENGNCLMCGVMLSSRLLQQASDDSQLYYCGNCGRIIYLL